MSRLEKLVQYTTLAVTTAQEISDAAQIPFLAMASTMTLAILRSVDAVKANKADCILMVEQIHDIMCTIISLCSMSELDGGLPPALLAEIAKFTERLRNVHTVVTALQGAGKVKQFFKQLDTAAHIKACKEDMDNTRAAFNIQAGAAAVGGALQMNKTAEKQHEALLAFIASHPELTNSELASLTSSRSNDSATSLSMLPPAPQIFYGRESELDEVLSMLKQDRARMVILGMGGMGKTTLATAALNHPDVIAKFPARYFVSCHSTASRDDLVSSIVAQLNLERGSNSVKKVLQHFTRGPATLLVLDNFETVWEPTAGRSKVEDFLSVLAEIPQLALLITMRGAERPQKVKWTRPFIPLLTPLSAAAALRTFLDIADDAHDPPSVQQLLEFTGNLPLAVNLMANVVAYEGCANTLARWASERTRLLSNGYDARSSLDISIMLSCSGARMTPPAQALLGLLAMLPDGLSEAELLQSALPIPNVLLCKAVLLRTSLAYVDPAQRLTLLFPIREYARVAHPPPPAVVAVFRAHVHRTLALWDTYDAMMAWEVAPRLALVVGNVQAVLSDALAQGADAQTVASVLAFSHLLREESQPSPLLEVLAKDANLAQTPEYGAYLVEKFWAAATSGHAGVEAEIVRGTEYFENREGIEKGRWFNALGSYYYRANNLKESLRNVQRAVELATSLPHPTREAMVALQSASMLLDIRGDHAAALLHAKRARACAELLVDLPGQVMSMSYEIRLCTSTGNFPRAAMLLAEIDALVPRGGAREKILSLVGEVRVDVHLMRSEYRDAERILLGIIRRKETRRPPVADTALDNLNLALVRTALGAEGHVVQAHLGVVRAQCVTFVNWPHGVLMCDMHDADLALRDGGSALAARMVFERLLAQFSESGDDEEVLFVLERLADPGCGMYAGDEAPLRWAGVYFALARTSENTFTTMRALRCLAALSAAQGDDETALSVFQAALDGFTLMGVHEGRGQCLAGMAAIFTRRGEVGRAVEALTLARAMFDRSGMARVVAGVDADLAALSER